MKNLKRNLIPRLFQAGILFSLLYIWIPAYFLTGDGPAHSYNAAIIKEMLLGRDTGLFSNFYAFNPRPEPNWLSHILLGLFQLVFSAPVAEKLVLSIYLFLMAYGFRFLLRQLSPGSEWLSVPALLLLFTHPLQMGFFNSGISVALLWWQLGLWLKWNSTIQTKWFLAGLLLSSVLFFTHMTGFMFWLMASMWLIIGVFFSSKPIATQFRLIAGTVLMHALPAVWLSTFLSDRGSDIGLDTSEWLLRLERLFSMHTLITLHHTEIYPAQAAAICLILIAVSALVIGMIKKPDITQEQRAFLPILMTVFAIYFFLPDWMASGGLFNIRTQYITMYFILLTASIVPWNELQIRAFSITGFAIFIWFMGVRFPVMQRVSGATKEYLSVAKKIPPGSTVLPLSFHHNGVRPDGRMVADRIWLFMHAGDYIGTQKPVIILSNYEAGAGFFPLVWKTVNPFWALSTGNGIEGQPPNVDIAQYEITGMPRVDYILLWCEGTEPWRVRNTPFREQLAASFELKAASENRLSLLYQRK
jgi:hypothetical protein